MRLPEKKRAYGEVPEHFRRLVADTLTGEEKPMRKKSLTAVWIAAALIIALAATAFAVGLIWTGRYEYLKKARNVMEKNYGLTPELLGAFDELGVFDNAYTGQTARYLPINSAYADRLGEYSVGFLEGSVPETIWSHDRRVALANLAGKGLDSPYWGAEQLALALTLEAEHEAALEAFYAGRGEDDPLPTMAELAALDAPLVEAGYPGMHYVMPVEGDITPEEAVDEAWAAAKAKYGFGDAARDDYTVLTSLQRNPDEAGAAYSVTFYRQDTDEPDNINVRLWASSGEVADCAWMVSASRRTLPDGSLDGMEEIVAEYVASGAFETLSHEDRAEAGARIAAAGYGAYLYNYVYATPTEGMISEDEARAALYQALAERYAIEGDDVLACFAETLSLLDIQGQAFWVLDLTPDMDVVQLDIFASRLGKYRLIMAADSGIVAQATWQFEEDRGMEPGYTEDTFGSSPGWTAEMLPWALPFMEEVKAFLDEHDGGEWDLETRAAYGQMFRDVGFGTMYFAAALPTPGELYEGDALDLAQQALEEAYGLTPTETNAMTAHSAYLLYTEYYSMELPVWEFTFYPGADGGDMVYRVQLDARSGAIIGTSTTPGNIADHETTRR